MSEPSILHITTDEKFINGAIYLFNSAFPGRNTFVVIVSPSNRELRYIRKDFGVLCLELNSRTLSQVEALCKEASLIVLHGLDGLKVKLFLRLKERRKFLWLVWGAEIYNVGCFGDDFIAPKTRSYISKLSRVSYLERIKRVYRTLRFGELGALEIPALRSTIRKFSAVGIINKEEIDLFKARNLIGESAVFVPFTYYPLEYIFRDSGFIEVGENILLGNSASPTNNHIEMIDLLAKHNLGKRRVIVPLSYGDMRYADIVVKYGKEILGESFFPIRNFLPLKEYNLLIASCGVVIMNMGRQQAVGNIMASMYIGCKVFLNDTTVYRYLNRLGCLVFSIRQDLAGPHWLNGLSREEVRRNRMLLEEEISVDVIKERLRSSILDYVK